MVRTQIQLTDEQARRLKAVAAREGISASAVVRRSLDKTLPAGRTVGDAEIRARAKSVAGCVRSGTGDLSTRHDEYLAEVYAD
jgi:hypothetical protein